MRKRMLALILACSMACTTGCGINVNVNMEKDTGALPDVGQTRHGFTVTERGSIDRLKAQTATFVHEKSGVTLFLIENEDPDLAFDIVYRVPNKDNTDIPHIFEHTIISASEKYPSSDLYFDLANKTYSTFVNAFTLSTEVGFPLASASEDQLIKMMDVYMSCMEAPMVLKDKRYFDREGLRYQLYDKADPIEMTGTVLSEDTGFMMNKNDYTTRYSLGEMYPGTIASCTEGLLYEGYENLSYDELQKVYDEYFSYDNAIILLYGKLDYERELAFLDENYLSNATRKGKNVLAEYDLTADEGFHEITVNIPAYEGDATEGMAEIDYNVDLSDFTTEEIIALSYLTTLLNSKSSPFRVKLKEAGINNIASANDNTYTGIVRPLFNFKLENADPKQAEPFYDVISDSLDEISKEGFSDTLFESVRRGTDRTEALSLESTNIGVIPTFDFISYFMLTGKTDYYELQKSVKKDFWDDKDQKLIKRLATKLNSPKSSCLLTAVPTPGLAEEKEAERREYLDRMKENMTDEELDRLIEDTLAFDEWNSTAVHNTDFIIDPKELPDPSRGPEVTVSDEEGISFLSVPVDIDDVGAFELRFDTSSLSQEELYELNYYRLAAGLIATRDHSAEELSELTDRYMSGFNLDALYPSAAGGEHNYPILNAEWTAMTDDFAASLDLVMEILTRTDFADADQNLLLLDKYTESFNPATREGDGIGSRMSLAVILDSYAYQEYLNGPGFYNWLKELHQKLSDDRGYSEEFADRMNDLVQKIIGKTDLYFVAIASEEDINRVRDMAMPVLKDLPQNETDKNVSYDMAPFDEGVHKAGIYTDSASQFIYKRYDLKRVDDMKGRYHPIYYAMNDILVVPQLRFVNGAYSAGMHTTALYNRLLIYSYKDPNVRKTIEFMDSVPDLGKDIELTEEDLNGYIARCYAEETSPEGILTGGKSSVKRYFDDMDIDAAYERLADERNATVDDLDKACAALKEAEQYSITVTSGNQNRLEAEADLFDQIIDYRGLSK